LTVDTVDTIILPAEPIRAEPKNTDMKNYEIKIKELENGNGYIYSTVINGCECGQTPNYDIGETYENQLGYKTEGEAIMAAAAHIKWELVGAERDAQQKAAVLLEQM
jgi:hypothetical protein